MRHLWLPALALLLAGCDDNPTTITHVGKEPHMKLEDLWTMQDPRGIPVEIHGRPFAELTDQTLAEALRGPAGASSGVKFYSRPVGAWMDGHGYRMVLHFNPQGAPHSYYDCRARTEFRTKPPTATGFTVNVSFCKGERSEAHGYLQAPKSPPGDLEEYARVMRVLMKAIFHEEPDR